MGREGSDFLAEQAVSFSSHLLLPNGNSGHEIEGKKENKRECVLLLGSFFDSTDMYHVPDPLLGLGIAKALGLMEFLFY